jgi:hypothetical protein
MKKIMIMVLISIFKMKYKIMQMMLAIINMIKLKIILINKKNLN